MEDVMIGIVWLGFFAAIFLGWYYYLKARNKERMALIESGKDVSEIYTKQEIRIRIPWLKIGLLITGVGLGLGLFMILFSFVPDFHEAMKGEIGQFFIIACMMFFGGMGLIVGYYLDKPKN
jgi:hypothetical protein